ncbi:HTTM domain-containing protein [Paracoccus sp. (in: a-proteobacteria)]|uniref:HTTM domain-containing protein n=1 Tax=Paracoccus sp. TaxID=267 RepID=UPI0026E0ECFB|nr:HTTM domain-containing protein [Paracoccus sp. (in: a-proteobacteria)]MDO5646604.1 HTTM domain-containing protein [Paracoccus sp. (in: a-proteobacteria)]
MKNLSTPVSIQSLAAFRIMFGLLLVWDCWRFVKYDRIARYWADPQVLFPYPGFGWVTPLPEPYLTGLWIGMGVAAAMVAVGLFYRVASVALLVIFSYFFLLDRAEYLNHFYLVILFAALLAVMPAHRAWSLDAWLRPGLRSDTVPYAAPFMLRAQMEIMLIYAGLVKLTPDWLAGQPLELWLRGADNPGPFGFLFAYDWFFPLASWGVIALHVLGAPLLMWKRTRLAVFLVYCAFHISNSFYFNIGIFPWMTIAATTIFFAPDWPGRLLGRASAPAPATRRLPGAVLAVMALWLAVQIALPVRGAMFDSDIRWSGEGHRFSWRMRIYDRDAFGSFLVTARTADGTPDQVWLIDPYHYLTARQTGKMMTRADMIHAFAAHLEREYRAEGYADIEVRADIWKSLNGRPYQQFIDPTVDLTAVQNHPLRRNDWILPLQVPVWGARDGNARDWDDPSPEDEV